MLKQGQILENKDGSKRKVLGVCGEVYFLSREDEFEKASDINWTLKLLKEADFIIPEEKWEPELKNLYWYIGEDGCIWQTRWDDEPLDRERQSFLGVYETEEKATQALEEIKKKLR